MLRLIARLMGESFTWRIEMHMHIQSRALYGVTQRLNELQLSKYGSHYYYRFVFRWHSRVLASYTLLRRLRRLMRSWLCT